MRDDRVFEHPGDATTLPFTMRWTNRFQVSHRYRVRKIGEAKAAGRVLVYEGVWDGTDTAAGCWHYFADPDTLQVVEIPLGCAGWWISAET